MRKNSQYNHEHLFKHVYMNTFMKGTATSRKKDIFLDHSSFNSFVATGPGCSAYVVTSVNIVSKAAKAFCAMNHAMI